MLLLEGERQVVQGHRVVGLGLQGCAVVLDGSGVVALGCQRKAQCIFDQRLGFGGFSSGVFARQLQIVDGLAVEPLAQLHGGQLVEVSGRLFTGFARLLQTDQRNFVAPNPQDLACHQHSGTAKNH
ncbi:hypothetical protein [Vulcanococcus sp.]|uniref:hypothetical protein n=1 Tax=Vulcanococcus sp. TaxID=2856995 RepID=UPI00342C29E1